MSEANKRVAEQHPEAVVCASPRDDGRWEAVCYRPQMMAEGLTFDQALENLILTLARFAEGDLAAEQGGSRDAAVGEHVLRDSCASSEQAIRLDQVEWPDRSSRDRKPNDD